MIVEINQTAGNFNQAYVVCGKGFGFSVNVGRFHRLQNISMVNPDERIEGEFQFSRWYHYFPLRWVIGKANITRRFRITDNGRPIGTVFYTHHGFLKRRYDLTTDDGQLLYGYHYAHGKFDYFSIYRGEEQIALLETYLVSSNKCYNHKLYIADEYDSLAQLLTFFAVYYCANSFVERGEFFFGAGVTYSYSLTRYRSKYNPAWREKNFPNDNFWGKINRFD